MDLQLHTGETTMTDYLKILHKDMIKAKSNREQLCIRYNQSYKSHLFLCEGKKQVGMW